MANVIVIVHFGQVMSPHHPDQKKSYNPGEPGACQVDFLSRKLTFDGGACAATTGNPWAVHWLVKRIKTKLAK